MGAHNYKTYVEGKLKEFVQVHVYDRQMKVEAHRLRVGEGKAHR